MQSFNINYSVLGMSDENSISPSSSKIAKNVNFPPCAFENQIENTKCGLKSYQRPRSMSAWSHMSDISRSSCKFDER